MPLAVALHAAFTVDFLIPSQTSVAPNLGIAKGATLMRGFRVLLAILATIPIHLSFLHAATPLNKIVVAYASLSPRVEPLWAAQENGIFGKECIEAEVFFGS